MWYIETYSSRYHYGVRIDELCDSFETRKQAEDFGMSIKENRPEYHVVLTKDGTSRFEVI